MSGRLRYIPIGVEDVWPPTSLAVRRFGDRPERLTTLHRVHGASLLVALGWHRGVADHELPAGIDLAGILEGVARRLSPIAIVRVYLAPALRVAEVVPGNGCERLPVA